MLPTPFSFDDSRVNSLKWHDKIFADAIRHLDRSNVHIRLFGWLGVPASYFSVFWTILLCTLKRAVFDDCAFG